MRRIIALLLCIAMTLTGCAPAASTVSNVSVAGSISSTASSKKENALSVSNTVTNTTESSLPQFMGLDDTDLTAYVEDLVYQDTITQLNDDAYVVEEVSAVYISKEYIEELAYNSQSNVYFGYTLDELNEIFQGRRYVFTLGDDGQTAVQELETLENTDTETVLKNVAVGSGVILICVTVSAVSPVVGAPAAVTAIFAASAETATTFAVSSAIFGGVSAAIVSGYQTGDWRESLQSFALSGSEGFKWGAIIGGVSGGTKEALVLKAGTKGGLTMSEVAIIQKESGYPIDVIKQFSNMEQYNICKNAGLTSKIVNGQTALIRNIDLNYADELGRTNLERMQQGLAAIDPSTGQSYQLHHIGQKANSTLAILTEEEHMQGGNNTIWHILGKATEVHGEGNTWDAQRKAFWISLSKIMGGL